MRNYIDYYLIAANVFKSVDKIKEYYKYGSFFKKFYWIFKGKNSYNLLVLWSFLEHVYNKPMKLSVNTRLESTTNHLAYFKLNNYGDWRILEILK